MIYHHVDEPLPTERVSTGKHANKLNATNTNEIIQRSSSSLPISSEPLAQLVMTTGQIYQKSVISRARIAGVNRLYDSGSTPFPIVLLPVREMPENWVRRWQMMVPPAPRIKQMEP